ncbi:hypothetical protein ACWF82_20925 [Nocardia sp. NPDC055053]
MTTPRQSTPTATIAAVGIAMTSVSSCTSAGTAVAQPRFDHVPASCAVALTPVRAEIDQFADNLRAADDRISTNPDPGLYEGSIGVRCVGIIFSGSTDTLSPLQDNATRETSRHLFIRFVVIPASDTVAAPVEHTRELFDQRRPSGAIDVPGIGEGRLRGHYQFALSRRDCRHDHWIGRDFLPHKQSHRRC